MRFIYVYVKIKGSDDAYSYYPPHAPFIRQMDRHLDIALYNAGNCLKELGVDPSPEGKEIELHCDRETYIEILKQCPSVTAEGGVVNIRGVAVKCLESPLPFDVPNNTSRLAKLFATSRGLTTWHPR